MFSKEKWIIAFKKQISSLWFHFVFWIIALSFYTFLVGNANIFQPYAIYLETEQPYFLIAFISPIIAVLFSLVDFLLPDKIMRILSFRITFLFKTIIYFLSAFILLVAISFPTLQLNRLNDYNYVLSRIPAMDMVLYRFLTFYYVACFFNVGIRSFMRKIGGVNIKKWIFGLLNKPHEDERIFMFLDLKDSTTIAEKLGHKKFSHLIQDVFNDMSVIYNYSAEIYNYLGDGAVVSWNIYDGTRKANCLRAYFAFSNVLSRRKKYYKRRYGIEPKFKAGAHIGKVMVLQIGQIRRDISYNGDTINTAARIESKCNELKQNMLISSDLYNELSKYKKFKFASMGSMQLKGKRKDVEIFAVKEKVKRK